MTHYSRTRFECKRWAIFLILALTYVLVFFHRMAPGAIADELMAAFDTSGARLGSLAAVYFIIYAIMQIPAGMLADTFGPRTTIIAGNIVAGTGSILFGLAGSFETACAARFLVGFGVSVIFISILKSNSVWFSEKWYAFMSGLTGFIGNIGSMTAAGPFTEILKVLSWRTVFYGIGGMSFTLALLGFLIVRNRPEDAGFPSVREMEGGAPSPHGVRSRFGDLFKVLKTRSLWPVFWNNFGITGSLYTFTGLWGIPYLRDVFGMERHEAGRYLTVTLITVAFSGLFFGWLSDHVARRKAIILGCAIAYLATWAAFLYLPWSPGITGYILFFCIGLTSTGGIVGFATAKEVTNPALSGTATSLVNTGTFVCTVMLQPFLGWILDKTWNGTAVNNARVYSAAGYHTAFLVIVACACLAVVAAFRIRETRGENLWEKENGIAALSANPGN